MISTRICPQVHIFVHRNHATPKIKKHKKSRASPLSQVGIKTMGFFILIVESDSGLP